MTTVGKILVIVIMVFAVVFLGISTVVFTTATNWKTATAAQKKKVDELTTKNRDFQTAADAAKKELEKAQADHKAVLAQTESRIKSLEDEIKTLNNEATAARAKLETAQQSANTSLALAEGRRSETGQLREQKAAVEKQANEFKLRQTELNDKIRDLERQSKTLDENNKDLRDRLARVTTLLRRAGLSDDITTVKGTEAPPPVQGEVSRVDPMNQKMEITIGSDDGLAPGHELNLYRLKPRTEYLGRVRIVTVDPDQAVARVIGKTVNGKKIQEGDIVSSTIRPRS